MDRPVLVATPHSHLFADPALAGRLRAASDLVEIRLPEQAGEVRGEALYHCELSLVAPWGPQELAELGRVYDGLRAGGGRLGAVSFHLASRYEENDLVDGAYVGRGEPMSAAAMLANAGQNGALARRALPATPLLVENNNHLGTDAYALVTDPAFIGEVMDQAGADLLLDVAHARISACNTGRDEAEYFAALGLDRALQVHLSRHAECGGRARDAHEALGEADWDYFAGLLPRLPGLRYATIEYYKDPERLLAQIARLREVLAGARA